MKRRKHLRAYTVECGGKRSPKKASDARVENRAVITRGIPNKKIREAQAKRIRNATSQVSTCNWLRAHTGVVAAPPARVVPDGYTSAEFLRELYK